VLRAVRVVGNSGTSGWSDQSMKKPSSIGHLLLPIQTKLNVVWLKSQDASRGKLVHNSPQEFYRIHRAKLTGTPDHRILPVATTSRKQIGGH
jgi:hypothetical protein